VKNAPATVARTTNNTELWDKVCSPDPKYTRTYVAPDGFVGTTINPNYLIRLATELWGPIGKAWRHKAVSERFVDGAPILGRKPVMGKKAVLDKTGALQGHQDAILGHEDFLLGREVIVHFNGQLIYPGGAVDTQGAWVMVGHNELGPFTDADAPKKARTNALSKALSHLGFGGDVFMGMWDDGPPEVAPAAEQPPAAKPRKKPAASAVPPTADWYAPLRDAITNSSSIGELQIAWKAAQKEAKDRKDTLSYGLLKSAYEAALMRLNTPAAKA
jgi:hypothetical protein